jgi:hypothetical protein
MTKAFLIELLSTDGRRNKIIFHRFLRQSSLERNFLTVWKYLKNEVGYKNEFLIDQILFNFDYRGNCVFTNLFTKFTENGSFFESLKGLDLTDGNFKDYLTQSPIFCFWIAQNVEARNGISKLFNEKFWKIFYFWRFFFPPNCASH